MKNNKKTPLLLTLGLFTTISQATTAGATSSQGATIITALNSLRALFSGKLGTAIGTIALAIGVIAYLFGNSTDLSPLLRIIIKIVFALSVMTAGASIIEGITGSTIPL